MPRVWLSVGIGLYILLAIHSEYWLGIVTTHPVGDDFKIYYGAYFKTLAGENPYEPYGIGSGYIYHPAALTFVSLFSWSRDQWFSTYLWIGVSAIIWGISVWLALKLARLAWADKSNDPTHPSQTRFTLILLFAFAPLWETLHIGQINTFVVLCLLLTLYFIHKEKPLAAGLSLALAIILKTSPIVLLGYLAVTRKFQAIFWTAFGLVGLSVLARIQFPSTLFDQFWAMLPRLGTELHPDTYNQSLISVLYQTFPTLSEQGLDHLLVFAYRAVTALLIGGLLLVGLLNYRHNRSHRSSFWLFTALAVTLVFFSPLVWYHHSTLLLLPLASLLVSPNRSLLIIGIGMMFVLQAERLFEQTISLTAYPIVIAHLALLATLSILYIKNSSGSPPTTETVVQA